MNNVNAPEVRYNISNDFKEVNRKLDKAKPVFLDLETDGLYGEIILAQFMQQDWKEAEIIKHPSTIGLTIFLSVIKDCKLVGQVISYDITTIQRQLELSFIPTDVDDTLFLARLHKPALVKASLDELYKYFLNINTETAYSLDKKALQKSSWVGELTDKQYLYAAADVFFLPDLYDILIKSKSPAGELVVNSLAYKLDKATLFLAFDYQMNGLPLLHDKMIAIKNANDIALKEINLKINPNSWQQVREYLDSYESDALALAMMIANGGEIGIKAGKVSASKKLIGQNSFINSVLDTDRARGTFSPNAVTGRVYSRKMNIQGYPKDLKTTVGFTPEDGKVLVYTDFSQLELRTITAITGDPVMAKYFKTGEDIHAMFAKKIFGPTITEEQRFVAKTCNFQLLYGGGVNLLRSILVERTGKPVSEDVCKTYIKHFRETYKITREWQLKLIREFKRNPTGATVIGRCYKANRMTDYLNIPNQSLGAEVAKLTLIRFFQKNEKLIDSSNMKLLNFIHDSYLFECDSVPVSKPEQYINIARAITSAMQGAWAEIMSAPKLKETSIPLPVEVYINYNWGDIEKEPIYFYSSRG